MNLNKAKALCRSLPGAQEDIKWGCHLVFSIGSKMFAITDVDADSKALRFKVDDERFLELTDRPGIEPSPYLARSKWIQITDPKALSDAEAAQLLKRSYELVFSKLTKKLQREIRGE